jgi:eukaryotic-like serine/threonine-protein kinase
MASRPTQRPREPGTEVPDTNHPTLKISRSSGTQRSARRVDAAELTRGQRIADRYVVSGVIADGATSTVYAARLEATDAIVAVKVQRSGFGETDVEQIDRLQLEALVYRVTGSEHVPRLLDTGRLPDGAPFIVTELVTGPTLADRLKDGTLRFPTLIDLGRQLMLGLAAVHAARVVHCDIKPSNIVLALDSARAVLVKIVDFGICERQRPPGKRSQNVVGTPSYMAPERIEGFYSDPRADLYSAGAVLYEALTGRLPFPGRTSDQTLRAALRDPLLPPKILEENCPDELDALLVALLEREPDARPRSAHIVYEILTGIVESRGLPSGSDAWRLTGSERQQRNTEEATHRLGRR